MKNLIIFYRNPELGKVKTRLAKTVGDEKALAIYLKLAEHTKNITTNLKCNKTVYYSPIVEGQDIWPNEIFQKQAQVGSDLGEKMRHAFAACFAEGYQSVCIIGTDCFELTTEIIEEAFRELETHDTIIGPAADGGYYLLGMKKLYPAFFQNKTWSSHTVCSDTLIDFKNLNLNHFSLETLTDVDEENDLPVGFSIP